MQKFERKIGDRLVTITIEKSDNSIQQDKLNGKETKKFYLQSLDGVAYLLGLDYTYDSGTYQLMLRRRQLYGKLLHDKVNFTKEEGLELGSLTTKLSDLSINYADGLFYEFCQMLDKTGGLDAYRQSTITFKNKAERMSNAQKILEELKQKRLLTKLADIGFVQP